jgi:hypothetical protein
MKEPYSEDLASHAGPESYAVIREGRREALTGVCAGRVLSPETLSSRVPTLFPQAEGNTGEVAKARPRRALRGLSPRACTETLHARTGRSCGRPNRMANRAALGSLEDGSQR